MNLFVFHSAFKCRLLILTNCVILQYFSLFFVYSRSLLFVCAIGISFFRPFFFCLFVCSTLSLYLNSIAALKTLFFVRKSIHPYGYQAGKSERFDFIKTLDSIAYFPVLLTALFLHFSCYKNNCLKYFFFFKILVINIA